ncbi:MAG TPA: helix-turn-helix domain-containing protein [Microvirga sp.]|jgi:transcriptional regulator GlxA family with amidase domain
MTLPTPRHIPVVVVLPPRTLLLDVAGPIEVLRKANELQDRIRFEVAYVGPSPTLTSSIGLVVAGVRPLPDTLPEGAVVVLSGHADEVLRIAGTGPGAPPDERTSDEVLRIAGAEPGAPADERAPDEIVAWLQSAIRPGMTLVTVCSGALLAARAGLLDGRDCTTHHDCCAELARLAPRARVLENRLFVEDGDRLTSAGITAGTDLMLHLVSRFVDPACAAAIARFLVVYLRRGGADPQFSPWFEGRNHLHPAIHRVQDAIAADPARAWSLPTLAAIAHASPRHLSRLFNEQTGMSLPDYINRLRVALARELLAQTRLDMERVAERTGFASSRQLRRAWSRYHAAPPREARRPIPATRRA